MVGSTTVGRQVSLSQSTNDRTLSGLPRPRRTDLRKISLGAVLIGPFEGSRWRLRRMRSGYGN
jgi:hypothetical protein